MKLLSPIKFINLSVTLLLMLSACSQPGNESVSPGNNGGAALPFAVSALPDPNPLKATLICPPDGSRVPMDIDRVKNTAKGSCSGLSTGAQTFSIELTYGTNDLMLANASKSINVGSGGNNLSFRATDYKTDYDADNDGISNLDEIINGTNPNLSYHLSGTVYGLASGVEITLQNNGGNTTTVTGNGGTQSFAFPSPIEGAVTYHVTSTVPVSANQICVTNHGDGGPISADVSDVSVTCVENTGKKIASFYSTYVIKPDGTLWAWGRNDQGQLGDGGFTQQNAPEQIGTDNHWASIASGGSYTVALKTDATLWTWGSNFTGELGDGTRIDRNVPMQVGAATDWINIAAGSGHSLALRKNGAQVTLWTWGENQHGQLGIGVDPLDPTVTDPNSYVPVQIGTATNWAFIAAGAYHSVAIQSDGSLWTWGYNNSGQLGDGIDPSIEPYTIAPKRIGNLTDQWVSVSAKRYSTVGLRNDSTGLTLLAWGNNDIGQLGDGSTVLYVTTPTTIPLPANASNWVSVESGNDFTIALAQGLNGTDITLWAWGDNNLGLLGGGYPEAVITTPKQVGTFTDWADIVASRGSNIIARRADAEGTFWAWGGNGFGQIGDGTAGTGQDKNSPTQIGTSTAFLYHTIGGTVSGLAAGQTLTLDNYDFVNDIQVDVTANGPFVFPQGYIATTTYSVIVWADPAGQTCVVSNGLGPVGGVSSNVWDISVVCSP